jgi:hypothetical protein
LAKVRKTHRSQPRQHGVRRVHRGAGLLPKLEAKLQADADRHGVSKSWILATIAAEYYNIVEQPDFREE